MKKKNIINTYGYIVIENKNHIPLHVVEIYHELHVGVMVFNSSKDANSFIREEKELIAPTIKYNPNFIFNKEIIEEYKNADNIFSNIKYKQVFCR